MSDLGSKARKQVHPSDNLNESLFSALGRKTKKSRIIAAEELAAERIVKPTKMVHFATEPSKYVSGEALVPSFASKKIKSFSRIKKHALSLLVEGEFAAAKSYLSSNLANRQKDFFSSVQGQAIFDHTLSFIANPNALVTILNFVDVGVLKDLLRQNDYESLKTFDESINLLKETSLWDCEQKNFHAKILALLSKGNNAVTITISEYSKTTKQADNNLLGILNVILRRKKTSNEIIRN